MKIIIYSWHHSEKVTKGLASVGLKHGDVLDSDDVYQHSWEWISQIIDRIYGVGLNVMVAHSNQPDTVLLGVSDDLFKQR